MRASRLECKSKGPDTDQSMLIQLAHQLADISVLVAYAAWRSAKTEETVKEHVSKSSSKWPAGSYTWGLAVYFIVALVLFTIEIRPPRSSYICSITSWRFHYIPVMQFACVVLDLSILILAIQLILRGRESTGVRVERSFHALGVALLVSAMIVSLLEMTFGTSKLINIRKRA